MADYIDDGFHDNGDYELIPNQLEVSKNYILGKDRKGTFAYDMEHLIGIKNLLILDKCMLSKDWCAVKGYNEEEFSKFVKEEDIPEGCCKSVFDVFKEDLEADYYTNLPYLKEEAVLRGKYVENSKYHKDFAELLSPKDVKLINDAIYSVGIFRNPKLMKDEVGQFDVGEGSFCLLDRDGKLFIASVSDTSPDYMDDKVVPVESLPRRVYTDLWDYNSCLECIYKLMDFTKNLVKIDIKSLFVFPCESNTRLRFYLVKNSDSSYTVSIIIPYMEIAY